MYENELIKIEEKDGKRLVSARELHEKLEVAGRFSRWFETYVTKYGFVEDQDFTSVQKCTVVNNGAEKEIGDYALTLDVAKHVCMLQRSELGMKFRQYFIDCEKKLQSQTPMLTKEQEFAMRLFSTNDMVECALVMKEYGEYKAQETKQLLEETVIVPLENKVEEQKPLVELCLKRRTSEGLVTITDTTKTFGLKVGQITVWSKTNGYIHKAKKEVNNKGDKYFRVYGAEYPNIGLTEDGVRLIESNLEAIKQSPCKMPKEEKEK